MREKPGETILRRIHVHLCPEHNQENAINPGDRRPYECSAHGVWVFINLIHLTSFQLISYLKLR